MRAVAHPVRVGLLELLYQRGPLTASACAVLLELSPKVCSYHLTLLGKYGLAEETGDGKGRARPWRMATSGIEYVHRPDEGRRASDTADQLARMAVSRDARIVEGFIAHRRELPRAWRNVSPMMSSSLHLTASQLRNFGEELRAVLGRYAAMSDVSVESARPVHVAMYAVPVELPDLAR